MHVATFYRFTRVAEPGELQAHLAAACRAQALVGTILIASEGINGTIAGSATGVRRVVDLLRADPRFRDMEVKHSTAGERPFDRMKVKVKREIVTFGAPEADPAQRTGTRVAPEAWDALIAEPGIVLIDTRNSYEIAIGTFPGAIDPGTENFGAFKDYVAGNLDAARDTRIAMFCTGGIRCEKASAYLLAQGFKEVFQLDGGILKYLEAIPPERTGWRGECYVFDGRVGLTPGLGEGAHRMCQACGKPVPEGRACGCGLNRDRDQRAR